MNIRIITTFCTRVPQRVCSNTLATSGQLRPSLSSSSVSPPLFAAVASSFSTQSTSSSSSTTILKRNLTDAASEEQTNLLESLANQRPTPLSLKNMYLYALSGNNNSSLTQRIRNAEFLHRELPIRIAQRVVDLTTLPAGLSQTKAVRDVCLTYTRNILDLQNLSAPTDENSEKAFTDLLRTMVLDRTTIPQSVNIGLSSLKDNRREEISKSLCTRLDSSLYRFFLARVGLRFLTEHHIACDPHKNASQGGLIDNECDPVVECKTVMEEVEDECKEEYGVCPPFTLVVPKEYPKHDRKGLSKTAKRRKRMTYVPTHLRYMLKELLTNSAVATIRRHDKSARNGNSRLAGSLNAQTEPLPDVRIIVAMGYEDVTIKITDQGGGISRSKLDSIWTFAHSTLSQSQLAGSRRSSSSSPSTLELTEPNIRGFGLPLARIYARYFGGELTLKSMEGYGVDTYLQLPILGADCENLPEAVAKSPGNTDSTEDDPVGQTWSQLLSKSL